jgi:hypothetical protein
MIAFDTAATLPVGANIEREEAPEHNELEGRRAVTETQGQISER